MIINKIVELGLQQRTKELREKNKSVREIAAVLTEESKQEISYQSVQRYFSAEKRQHKDLIEKKENLQAKVVEAEIDTITRRHKIFDRLERIADKAEKDGIDKTVIEALKVQISALDSLDKRLGRFTEKREVEVKGAAVVFYIPDNSRDKQKEIEGT